MLHTARCVDDAVADGAVPGIAAAVRVDGRLRLAHVAGTRWRGGPPVTANTPFDLASVTKALVGATCAAAAVERGELDPDAPLPEIAGAAPPTLRDLLAHAGGFAPWRPLYREVLREDWGGADARAAVIRGALTTPRESPRGARYAYSDLGYLAVLAALERTGPIAEAWEARIRAPSGVAGLTWGAPEAAATEDCPVRDRRVIGEVHDLNCAAMGGTSSHAGLFGNAEAVAAYAEAVLAAMVAPDTSPLPGHGMRALLERAGPGAHRGGWDHATPGGSTGDHFPADTLGHLGYTGTSVWMSPSRGVVAVLLTNRVHPDDDKRRIRELRRRFHDAVARDLGWGS